ncbi:rhodanese-like domain-containing protein [Marinilactibacillus piezotolerans]|uniref:rhodanese-like domain-containing protein n=1 Tax=Marinilactibacillus piezotolerans TaxID=258723 RepID=UPI0009AFDEA5|nr:rhodanese-like domain-containing protein [Marinilactibacillus piezotolerans]
MVKTISMEEFYPNHKTVQVIDVREEDEFTEGHIEGAKNVPLSELENRLEEFGADQEYYVICRSGRRSANACERLAQQANVTNVEGGMLAFQEKQSAD